MRYLMTVTRNGCGSQTTYFKGGRRAMLEALPMVLFALTGSQNTASVETCNAAEQFNNRACMGWSFAPFAHDFEVKVRRYPESDYKG